MITEAYFLYRLCMYCMISAVMFSLRCCSRVFGCIESRARPWDKHETSTGRLSAIHNIQAIDEINVY